MKKLIILLVTAIITQQLALAQNVGIGTATPDSSAMLEINSSNKGLLLPRIKDTSAIKNPAKGLLIYSNYDNIPWYYDGSQWQSVAPVVINATSAPGPGKDSLWYRVQDSIVYTYYPYVHINTEPGLIAPQAALQATGNLLIQGKLKYSTTLPSAAQTFTMNNTATMQIIPETDSVFRIYDPGGTGNYNNNMQGNVSVSPVISIGVGLKVSSAAADFGLGDGDTLWVAYDAFPACRNNYAYFFTKTSVNPADFMVPSGNTTVYFIFRSNADGINGKGFNFSVTRLYNSSTPNKIQSTGPALYFNSSNGSFAAGFNADVSTTGTAFGAHTRASGGYSTAMGYRTIASGNPSTAMGNNTTASGNYSTAMGFNTTASGSYSTATGVGTTASGYRSTAMGNYVSTNNFDGSFIIGDNSTGTVMNSANANNFRARFAGGYRFYTSSDYSTSCLLAAGSNAWTTTSSVHTKENFAEVNGEDFLRKISSFHLTTWNYKTQNPATFRHYGPMAQDFYAAFGKDKYGTIGNDTTINSADFAGVSFIAIQALEKRTQKIEQLEKENAELKKVLMQLKNEVDALKEIKKKKYKQ